MKILTLTIFTLLSISNVFAMSESSETNCKNMVSTNTDESVQTQVSTPAPVIPDSTKR